jgi:translation initiation factor IF-2
MSPRRTRRHPTKPPRGKGHGRTLAAAPAGTPATPATAGPSTARALPTALPGTGRPRVARRPAGVHLAAATSPRAEAARWRAESRMVEVARSAGANRLAAPQPGAAKPMAVAGRAAANPLAAVGRSAEALAAEPKLAVAQALVAAALPAAPAKVAVAAAPAAAAAPAVVPRVAAATGNCTKCP